MMDVVRSQTVLCDAFGQRVLAIGVEVEPVGRLEKDRVTRSAQNIGHACRRHLQDPDHWTKSRRRGKDNVSLLRPEAGATSARRDVHVLLVVVEVVRVKINALFALNL